MVSFPVPSQRWARLAAGVALGLLLLVDLGGIALQIQLIARGRIVDFNTLLDAANALTHGRNIYDCGQAVCYYRWSPVAAVLLVPLVAVGLTVWRAAHFASLLLLRDWRLIGLVLLLWPFWADVEQGNVVTFAFVAAALAIRGSRLGGIAYLGLFLLMPRPLMVPVAVWLLWQRPEWRLGFVLAGLAELAAAAGMGYLGQWLQVLLGSGSAEMASGANLAPSALLGSAWLAVAWPLAAWLTWRGHLGLASLLASPYWLLYYPLFLVLELVPRKTFGAARRPAPAGDTFRARPPSRLAAFKPGRRLNG